MLSRHTMVGRLTDNPVIKTVNGKKVAEFTIACDDPFSRDGDADFYRCVAWEKVADLAEKHLNKGRLVLAEGRPKNRSYMKTKDGVEFKQYSQETVVTQITFLDKKDSSGPAKEAQPASNTWNSGGGQKWGVQAQAPKPAPQEEVGIDDVPF